MAVLPSADTATDQPCWAAPPAPPVPTTSQLAQLKAAGCERVFEKISGATADRPQLNKLLETVEHGDVVIIPAVDRLSRDTTDLLVIARDLQKAGACARSRSPSSIPRRILPS
jgi:hypothetical protein